MPIEKNKVNAPFTKGSDDPYSEENMRFDPSAAPVQQDVRDPYSDDNLKFDPSVLAQIKPPAAAPPETDPYADSNVYGKDGSFASQLAQNQQFVDQTKDWYKTIDPTKQFASNEELVDTYQSDMRSFDNQLFSVFGGGGAIRTIAQLTDAASNGNTEAIAAFKNMRDTWDIAPAFWQQSGGGLPALAQNVWAGATDITTLATLGAGKVAASLFQKGAVTIGTGVAVDIAAGAALNVAQQKAEQEAALRDNINPLEAGEAGALQALFPFAVFTGYKGIRGTIKGSAAVLRGIRGVMNGDNFFVSMKPKDVNPIVISPEAMKLADRNIAQPAVDEHKPTISVIHKDTNNAPFRVVGQDSTPMQANGKDMIFSTKSAADNFVELHKLISPDPLFTQELKFQTRDKAREFLATRGNDVGGTTDLKEYGLKVDGMFSNTKDPNPLARMKNVYNEVLQTHLEDVKTLRNLQPTLHEGMKGEIAAGRATAQSLEPLMRSNMVADMIQIENREVVAKKWSDDKPVISVPDPVNRGQYMYVEAHTQGLKDIVVKANMALQAAGIFDTQFSRKLSTYLLSRRALEYRAHYKNDPITPGKELAISPEEATAMITDITRNNHPVVKQVFEDAANDLQAFHRVFMDFLINKHVLSPEAAKDMQDVSSVYLPHKIISEADPELDLAGRPPSAPSTGNLRKRVSAEYDKYQGNKYIDPLKMYQDFVELGIKAAMVNDVKVKQIMRIEAAGSKISNTILKRIPQTAKSKVISKDQVQAILRNQGLNIDLRNNPQIEPLLRIYFREMRWGDEQAKGRDFVYMNGKPVEFEYKDKLIGDALRNYGTMFIGKYGYGEKGDPGRVPTWLANQHLKFTKFIQRLVTYWPPIHLFMLWPADVVFSAIASPVRSIRSIPFIGATRELFRSMKDPLYQEALNNGALLSGAHNMSMKETARTEAWMTSRGIDPKSVIGMSREQDDHILTTAMTQLKDGVLRISGLKAVGDLLSTMAQRTEASTRLNTYIAHKNAGYSIADSASAAARYSINFRVHGSNTTSHALQSSMFPFAKALINVVYQTNQLMTEKNFAAERWVKTAGYMIIPTVLLAFVNAQDQKYKELTPLEKDMYYHVPIPWTDEGKGHDFIRIRKTGYLSTIPNVLRRVVEDAQKDELSADMGKAVFMHVVDALVNDLHFGDPAGLSMLWGYENNKDMFGRPIDKNDKSASFGEMNRLTGSQALNNNPWLQEHLASMQLKYGFAPTTNQLEFFIKAAFAQVGSAAIDISNNVYKMQHGTWQYDPEQAFMIGKVWKSNAKATRYTSYEDEFRDISDRIMPISTALDNIRRDDPRSVDVLNSMEGKYGQQFNRVQVIAEHIKAVQTQIQDLRAQMVMYANENIDNPHIDELVNSLYQKKNDLLSKQVWQIRDEVNAMDKIKHGVPLPQIQKELEDAMARHKQ